MTWLLLLSLLALVLGVLCWRSFNSLQRCRKELLEQQAFVARLMESRENERKRLGAELHGTVGQNLLIIKNRAALGLAAGVQPQVMTRELQEISRTCSQAIEESRRLAHNLGPRHVEQLGLTEALDAMIDRVAASTQINFERRLEFVDDLFENQPAINLYRVAQEALNNVMRHAQPTSARVELKRDLRHVQLIIQDNGRGFDMSNGHREKGIGLAEMGERVRILNGRIEIATQPGAGTKITATIPVDEAKATSISPAPRV